MFVCKKKNQIVLGQRPCALGVLDHSLLKVNVATENLSRWFHLERIARISVETEQLYK